jgi:hypothetical protein
MQRHTSSSSIEIFIQLIITCQHHQCTGVVQPMHVNKAKNAYGNVLTDASQAPCCYQVCYQDGNLNRHKLSVQYAQPRILAPQLTLQP